VWRKESEVPTTLAIDDRLIDEARVLVGHKTKKQAVTAALAVRHDLAIFTTDAEFVRYARILPIRLHRAGAPT
jgi:hypothetical protein